MFAHQWFLSRYVFCFFFHVEAKSRLNKLPALLGTHRECMAVLNIRKTNGTAPQK